MPLFGLSQGVGVNKTFKKDKIAYADDLLAGIKLIQENGLIAYVPQAGVYHYHVDGIRNFIKKYTWRIRNNLHQQIKGMGVVNRTKYFPNDRKVRMYLFIPYGLTILFPFIDSLTLAIKNRDIVMLWHTPICFVLSIIIIKESLLHLIRTKSTLGTYE
jgi:GT2 family glycosyltransferase